MNPEQDHNRTGSKPPQGYQASPNNSMPLAAKPGKAVPLPAAPNPLAPKKKSSTNWKSVVGTILLFLLAPIIALCIAAFVIQSYEVDGVSMENTLQNNDRLIVDKVPRTWARITHHAYIPARGNIIIFNESGLPDSGPSGTKQLVKRVIGLPGDRVVIGGGKITIYNKANPNGFDPDTTVGYHISATTTSGSVNVTLGPNQIFVCGDNRPNSEDSRFFGPINANQIVGKLVLRLLPLSKIQEF